MKKILLALLIFSSAISYGLAQTWTRMQSWGSDFEAIYWITEEKGVIVGENLITYTEDGGATWNEVLQKFDYRLKDVLFFEDAPDHFFKLHPGQFGIYFPVIGSSPTFQTPQDLAEYLYLNGLNNGELFGLELQELFAAYAV